MRKIAFMYDFDETLSKGEMQYKELFQRLNQDPESFWVHNDEKCLEENSDVVLGYMYNFMQLARKNNVRLNREFLIDCGRNITFFKGVEDWFDRINEYGLKKGFLIEHYIISCGIKEIMEGSSIASKFKRIFANCYSYNEEGEAYWLSQIVNFTTKTQYIFRIKKDLLDNLSDIKEINVKRSKEEQLPYANMIYFGDGDTDIPCMKVVKDKGGHSVCVFDSDRPKKRLNAMKILTDGRVNAVAEADYSEGSALDLYVKKTIDKLAKFYAKS